jgi:hypothetical protein
VYALSLLGRAAARTILIAAALLSPDVQPGAAQPVSAAAAPFSARIALVPLDDRPLSLQYPVLAAAVADAEIVAPPRGMLGRHLRTGDGEAIARWLDGLDLSRIDAAIVSADMLAYGGLIGSRVPRVFEAEARERLTAIARLKGRRPHLPVFVIATIPRHAPTDDGGNEKWRAALTGWAEAAGAPEAAAEREALEKTLPAGLLDRYRAARARNQAVNLALVDLARQGAIDLLVVGRDDASPRGLQAAEAAAVAAAVAAAGVGERVRMQPGADEIALLLVSRALSARAASTPGVHVTYSSDAAGDMSLPDGRSLKDVVASQVAAAGGRVVDRAMPGALRLFVYAPLPGGQAAEAFAARIGKEIAGGARALVVDAVLSSGEPGPSLGLVEGLRARRLLPRLVGYASGPPGSAIGTAVAQGMALGLSADRLAAGKPDVARRAAAAHLRLLLHRFVSDFLYHGVIRPQAIEDVLAPRGMNPLRLDDPQRRRVEKYLLDELRPLAEGLVSDFSASPWRLPGSARGGVSLQVRDIEGFQVGLPWARLSEAEIDFTLVAPDAIAQPRPPRPRVIR